MHSQRSLLALSLIFSTARASGTTKTPTMRRSLIFILLAVGIALDLLISAALFYAVRQAKDAASEVHIVKVAAFEACRLGNEQKAADLQRWNDVLGLVENGNKAPGLSEFVAGVNKANLQADSPRDCGKLVP